METVGVLDTGRDVMPMASRILETARHFHRIGTVGPIALASEVGADHHSEALVGTYCQVLGEVVDVIHRTRVGL
jgi:hypothetical protein